MSAVASNAPAPSAFHLLAKPAGAICNLDCDYCFYLSKERLYPGSRFRMAEATLEAYVRQLLEAHQAGEVTVAWQGGEPMLMGLDFFRRSLEYQNRYRRPDQVVRNTIQTNGVLIDHEWAEFFRDAAFLVGVSIDGPRALHDAYRRDKRGRGTFDEVVRGIEVLRAHAVEFNALVTLHRANADHPLEVYRFLRDELKARYLQLIPIVERAERGGAGPRAITAQQYGAFLTAVFEEWVRRDVGTVYVDMFDTALGNWLGRPGGCCVFSPTCGLALALEHNGDLYSCDHFVEPPHLLGNIAEAPMIDLVASAQQRTFGRDKLETLPDYCRRCDVRFACHGGCPKDRFIMTPDGEPGLNYLCAGYKVFFTHVDRPMRIMADSLRRGRAPAEIMQMYAAEETASAPASATAAATHRR